MTTSAKHTRTRARSSSKNRPDPSAPRRPHNSRRQNESTEVLDLAAVQAKQDRAARLVINLFEDGALPDWLTDGIMRTLEAATDKTGIGHYGEKGFDPRGLADLLAVADDPRYSIEMEPKKDLPELISAVLKHPDTPATVYDALSGAVTDLVGDSDSTSYVRLALEQNAAARSNEGGEG